MEEKIRLEVEVPIMGTNSQERTITKASDYHLFRDMVRREIMKALNVML